MTKLLERAIAKARDLTDAEQDEAAEILLWAMGDGNRSDDAARSDYDLRRFGGHGGGFDPASRDKA